MNDRALLARAVWAMKAALVGIPGVYTAYKWFTTRLGEGKVYRIRLGPMKGMLWRRRNTLPYWYHLGMYEPHVSELIVSQLSPGSVFWDIGANAGYHSLMAARTVGPTGKVVAVEADPRTAEILRDEIALNRFSNCVVLEVAVSETNGTATFSRKPNNLQSALSEVDRDGEQITVATRTLDSLAEEFGRPTVIKMDIEGAETMALPGGSHLFSSSPRPRLMLSVHGPRAADFCRSFLQEHGYGFEEQSGFEQMWLAVPRAEK